MESLLEHEDLLLETRDLHQHFFDHGAVGLVAEGTPLLRLHLLHRIILLDNHCLHPCIRLSQHVHFFLLLFDVLDKL